MADQIITTQSEAATTSFKARQPGQLVRFTFYKLDPQWQLLPAEIRQQGKQELERIFEEYNERCASYNKTERMVIATGRHLVAHLVFRMVEPRVLHEPECLVRVVVARPSLSGGR